MLTSGLFHGPHFSSLWFSRQDSRWRGHTHSERKFEKVLLSAASDFVFCLSDGHPFCIFFLILSFAFLVVNDEMP